MWCITGSSLPGSREGCTSTDGRIEIGSFRSVRYRRLQHPSMIETVSQRNSKQPKGPLRPSLFGDGLLERTRSTLFALVGIPTAVGLAAVAFALQLRWPIDVEQPLPDPPPKHQAVAPAVAVSDVNPSAGHASRKSSVAPAALQTAPDTPPVAARAPVEATDVVVSNPEPVPLPPQHGKARAPIAPTDDPPPPPMSSRPASSDQAAEVPSPAPPPQPMPQPPPQPAPEPVAESSDVPGNGNAFGKGNGKGPPSPPPAVGNPHGSGVGGI
jgi:hypothetical protein